MKYSLLFTSLGLVLAGRIAAQDLTNAGAIITVQAGALLYVGTGGLTNQAGSTLTNAGTLRVDGPWPTLAPSAWALVPSKCAAT